MGVDIVFRYKDDYNEFVKLLDLKKHSYICRSRQDEKGSDVLLKHMHDKKDRATIKMLMPNKCAVFVSKDRANKFIKNTLKIEVEVLSS
ncbi:Predicted protein [Wolbachia endosymbiont strain TRS of Brugia malayi]|uniref:hypothetical protein n=1 Tax=Wolbachia endosymbiont of Brugia malayi TaxID=80849 RepID=UPI00004C9516|nr:hypothetical protein [Wolbachia endosymbiont of Brugia malayi]AAW71367.1 Predicted protein [Wolbachia endosymbiont strain TRS of Brugia malayi]